MPVKFEYWQSEEDGSWYFHLIALNGGVISHSGAYLTEDQCLEGIEKVRLYSRTAIVVQPDVAAYY